jgi:hypothetical protein
VLYVDCLDLFFASLAHARWQGAEISLGQCSMCSIL